MKLFAKRGLEPRLNTAAVHAMRSNSGYTKATRNSVATNLRTKFGTLGNAARHNRRYRGGEGQQEEI